VATSRPPGATRATAPVPAKSEAALTPFALTTTTWSAGRLGAVVESRCQKPASYAGFVALDAAPVGMLARPVGPCPGAAAAGTTNRPHKATTAHATAERSSHLASLTASDRSAVRWFPERNPSAGWGRAPSVSVQWLATAPERGPYEIKCSQGRSVRR
jgi:hypothetical protein